MRLLPAQVAVYHICGHSLPMEQDLSKERLIEQGRRELASITGSDYGYDLRRWHDHLKVSREGGYTWNRRILLPKIMKQALDSEEWHAAVRQIKKRNQAGLQDP